VKFPLISPKLDKYLQKGLAPEPLIFIFAKSGKVIP